MLKKLESLNTSVDSTVEEVTFKTIFNMIYRDQFKLAYDKLDTWSIEETRKPFPEEGKEERIFNLMKYVKYCLETISPEPLRKIAPGEETYHYWQKQWAEFEEFVKSQMIYYESNFLALKNYFYQRMIDNLILEYNSQSYYSPIMLETCKKLMEIGSWEKSEEGFNYLKKKKLKSSQEIDLQLAEIYYYRDKKDDAMVLLKNLLFYHPKTDLSNFPIPEIKTMINQLFLAGFTSREVSIWLPAYLRIGRILPNLYSLDTHEYKECVIRLDKWEKSDYDNLEEHRAHLIYRYLFIMDQIYIRVIKGKSYLIGDLKLCLNKLKNINQFFYQQVKTAYDH